MIFANKFGGTGTDVGSSVSVDRTGYILTTGSFSSSFTFVTTPVVSAGVGDIFLWRRLP